MLMRRQNGFTLVEIAIVLVIIGLLLGGILKGQELINSARVRNLADTATGIQAAYYGFIDRYRRIPGDWNATGASQAIGITINDGGDDNGRIDNPAGGNLWEEPNALWVQLAAAGFIQGAYGGGLNAPTNANNLAPLNAFNNVMVLGRADDFLAAPSAQLHLIMGAGIPVDVMQELDLKLDDGTPDAGDLRATDAVGSGALLGGVAEGEALCVTGAPPNATWNIRGDAQGCNAVYIF
jgi:prepilin-type N-terminal cleavage/methylation domain-containing protein